MKWMNDPSYWLAFAEGLRIWLLSFVPSFLDNSPLRALCIFIIVNISFSLISAVVRLAARGVNKALSLAACAATRWLVYDFAGLVASIYVHIEAAVLRVSRPPIQTSVLGRSNEMIDYYQLFGGVFIHRPVSVVKGLLASITLITIGLPAAVFSGVFAIVRRLTRINILNIASAITTLWISDLLHLRGIGGNLQLGQIPVSTLVIFGTLLALVFVALNIDVRGKAELNKVASLTCRTALHETTPKLFRIASALCEVRSLAIKRLASFPTASELFELTGRDDLCWRSLSSRLLPVTASLVPESASPLSVKLSQISECFVDPEFPQAIPHNSIIRVEDISSQDLTLMRESKSVCDIINRLYESGMAAKLNKALSLPARYFLVDLYSRRFGSDTVDVVHLPADDQWYDILDQKRSAQLQDQWGTLADADPNDPHLRKGCIELKRELRSTLHCVRSSLWLLALDEYRLRYLAEAIDSSLRPRLFDRIRQLFDK